LISNIFAVLFYGTLFLFVFIKVYNYILIKKHNCKDLYKKQKKEIKQSRFSKVMKILLIVLLIGMITYIPYGIANFYFSLVFMIFDNGEKLSNSFNMISIVIYFFYFVFILYKLYINILLNKFLRK